MLRGLADGGPIDGRSVARSGDESTFDVSVTADGSLFLGAPTPVGVARCGPVVRRASYRWVYGIWLVDADVAV